MSLEKLKDDLNYSRKVRRFLERVDRKNALNDICFEMYVELAQDPRFVSELQAFDYDKTLLIPYELLMEVKNG